MSYWERRPNFADRARDLAFLTLGSMLLIAPVAISQESSTKADSSFDFARQERFAWRENRVMTRQHPDTNGEMDVKIIKAVNRSLTAGGFARLRADPTSKSINDGDGELQADTQGEARANSAALAPNDRTPA